MQYTEHVFDVPPIDFDFSISWCERVSEWTFIAHWLSETSPRKARGFCPYAEPASARMQATQPSKIRKLMLLTMLLLTIMLRTVMLRTIMLRIISVRSLVELIDTSALDCFTATP